MLRSVLKIPRMQQGGGIPPPAAPAHNQILAVDRSWSSSGAAIEGNPGTYHPAGEPKTRSKRRPLSP